MAVFIMLTQLTSDGVKTIKDNPARVHEVNKEVEQLGVKVLNQWATLGRVRLRQRRRGARREDDGQGLGRDGLARHDLERDHDRDHAEEFTSPSEPEPRAANARPGRRRRRARARDRPCSGALAGRHRAPLRARATRGSRPTPAASRSEPRTSPAIVDAAVAESVDLVVVGPEAPLVGRAASTRWRPTASPPSGRAPRRRRLEGSKVHAKELMAAAGVPTAGARRAAQTARRRVEQLACASYPAVLKADGLAAGKGVIIAADRGRGPRGGRRLLRRARASATTEVVLEEYLEGEELSLLALCDGENVVPLAPAQDYKRIFDGDEGPNTGGMGSYSPVPGFEPRAARGDRRRASTGRSSTCMRAPRHAVPRRALRGADDHRRRAQGARVQLPLRRPGDPGGAAAPAHATCSSSAARRASPAASRARARSSPTTGRSRWCSPRRGYPESSLEGRRDQRARTAAVDGVEVTHAGTARAATARSSPRAGGS